eukprot:gene12931-15198_t
MRVTWVSLSPLAQPTVYYHDGACGDKEGEITSPLKTTEEADKMHLSVGTSRTYHPYQAYIHSVVLTSLLRSHKYCYCVGGHTIHTDNDYATSWSAWREIDTVPTADQPVVFAAFADSGTYGNVFQVMEALHADTDITMVVHAGDLSYGLNESTWDLFGNIIEPLASVRPYMVIPGNWDVKPAAVQAFTQRYPMPLAYPLPTTKLEQLDSSAASASSVPLFKTVTQYNLFYSFDYSHVYMIMLSSYDPYDESSVQYQWLVKQLKFADSNRHIYPWIVVCAHSPMYSSSTGHGGSDLAFREKIEPLLEKYSVNLVISGHDHGYERSYPVINDRVLNSDRASYNSDDGTIHILAGTGGADADPWLDQPDWSLTRESSAGYTKIRAHLHSLEVTFVRINGTIGDHFLISNVLPQKNAHTVLYIILFLLAVAIFPVCAYFGIPNKVFHLLVQNDPYLANKSEV